METRQQIHVVLKLDFYYFDHFLLGNCTICTRLQLQFCTNILGFNT